MVMLVYVTCTTDIEGPATVNLSLNFHLNSGFCVDQCQLSTKSIALSSA